MKAIHLFTISFVFFLITFSHSSQVYAQRKSKEEIAAEKKRKQDEKKAAAEDKKRKKADEKAVKDELKKFQKNPQAYLEYKRTATEAMNEASKLKEEVVRLKSLEQQCAQEEENLKKQIEELLGKNKALEEKKASADTKGFSIPSTGTFYVVQIGAFQHRDVATNDNNPDFRKENSDGFNRYIMGVFEDVTKADELRKFLMQIDFRSSKTYRPFLAPYKDGKRVSLEEALGPDEAKKYKR
jgi:hypothetical protein